MLINVKVKDKTIGAKDLFHDLDFSIEKKEKVAIIGRNGVGKTTLFNMLSGDDNFFAGKIEKRRDLKIAATKQEFLNLGKETCLEYICNNLPEYLELKDVLEKHSEKKTFDESEIEEYSEAVDRFSSLGYYDIENMIQKNLDSFGVTKEQAKLAFTSLSGGQKRFADLVRVELSDADIALVDEPTNHMDYVGKEAFIKWLRSTNQAVAVITHDRDILANVQRIIEIKDKKAFSFSGNYDAYLAQNGSATLNEINTYEVIQRTLNKLKKQILEARAKKMAAPGDSAIKFRIMEERLQREYDKLKATAVKPSFWVDQETVSEMPDKVVEKYEKYKAKNIRIHKHNEDSTSRGLLVVNKISIGYEFPLFEDVNFELSSGDRIQLKGRNGAGKTSLIKAILETEKEEELSLNLYGGNIKIHPKLKIGYYEQEVGSEYLELPLIEAITKIYHENSIPVNDQKARQILADYLFDPLSDGLIKVKNLSGGQKARLQIIKMLARKPNLLILDEPTNHLDLPSIEELEKNLRDYDGAILFVSHDTYFAKKLGGEVINIGD